MGSTRLPGKVLRPIVGHPMLWHVVERARQTPGLAEVVVATSDQSSDEPIHRFCREEEIPCFAGSEEDVLDRFYQTAREFAADPVMRITGDCPFVDPVVIGRVLELYQSGQYDHVGVATGAGAVFMDGGRFPDGLDTECTRFAALERAWHEATEPSDREHVTPYLWRVAGRFRLGSLKAQKDYSSLRWTVDNEADFELICKVYEALYHEERPFLMEDILRFFASNPDLAEANRDFIGQEGYAELWTPNNTNGSPVSLNEQEVLNRRQRS